MSTVQQLYDGLAIKEILEGNTYVIAAANFAIRRGARQGFVLSERINDAGTFVSGTFNYTMSTSLDRFFGVGEVLVNVGATSLEVRHRELCQYYDNSAGAWILEFPEKIVGAYVGQTFDIRYFTPHPRVTLMTDEVPLPDDYAMSRMSEWASLQKMAAQNKDTGPWANVFVDAKREANAWMGDIPPRVPVVRRKDRPG